MPSSALFLLPVEYFELIYGPEGRAEIESRIGAPVPLVTAAEYAASDRIWPEVEIVFSGWGMVPMDEAFLARFPNLRAVFYGAGTIKGIATEAFWERGIAITSSYAANAVPVSEYALSQILFGLKRGWQHARAVRRARGRMEIGPSPGGFRSTVALLSLGMIGRRVAGLLRSFDVRVAAYDPFLSPERAAETGVAPVSLEEAFAQGDVVSCHTPNLPATVKMIGYRHFAAMKQGATFLNTARGAVVDEEGLIAALRERPDLTAVLDVTWPEPPVPDSPLYTLENVVLTPHIAGSQGMECRRMGQYMIEELDLFRAGKPLRYGIDRARAQILA